jgi:hypothetical protein
LTRRAQISDAANARYLEALASVTAPLGQACTVCRPLTANGQLSGLIPGPEDGTLLQISWANNP